MRSWVVIGVAVLLPVYGCDGGFEALVPFALAVDCGRGSGEGGDERSGTFVADVAYSEGLGYGFDGGEPASWWFPPVVGATPFTDAYRLRRDGATAYRVDVPQSGLYVVTLGFCERDAHGPGFRLQDVRAEGSYLLDDLDVFAVAGQDQAWFERHVVDVTDGVLDLGFASQGGLGTSLATLAVERATPAPGTPDQPSGVEAMASYGAVVVAWEPVVGDPGRGWDPMLGGWESNAGAGGSPFGGVAGYRIERADAGSNGFAAISGAPWPLPYFVDASVAEGQLYDYRVRAVDVWGIVSDPSDVVEGSPRSLTDCPLPVYEIFVDADDLAVLQADPYGDEEVPLTFVVDGVEYVGDGRFRGASNRGLAKKSWRVELETPMPDGRQKLDLKSEWGDWTQLQEVLSYDLFVAESHGDRAEAQGGGAWPVQLMVNGEYDGLRLDVERMDEDFLVSSGRDPAGDLFRGGGFGELYTSLVEIAAAYERRAGTGDVEQLAAMLEFVGRAHRHEFADELDGVLDLDAYIDYLAVNALLGRPETEANDYFYYRDAQSGLWEVLTWDNNNGNFGLDGFWPGEAPHTFPWAEPVHMSLWYAESPETTWWHLLRTRLLNHGDHRAQLVARIEALLAENFTSGSFGEQVHQRAVELGPEINGDPFKYPWARHDPHDLAEGALLSAIEARSDILLESLTELATAPSEALVIDEFGVEPCAEAGSCSPYGFVELHNTGEQEVELAGYHLTDDLRNPLAFPLPEGVLGPGERLVLEASAPDSGEWYRLDLAGGELGLFFGSGEDGEWDGEGGDDDRSADREEQGFRPVDLWWYGRQTGGISYGRVAGGGFAFHLEPSPGDANGGPTSLPPQLGIPQADTSDAGGMVVVTVAAEHDGGMGDVTCYWSAGSAGGDVTMLDDGSSGDGDAGDGVFGGILESLPDDATVLELYVLAHSADGVRQVSPRLAPSRLRQIPL